MAYEVIIKKRFIKKVLNVLTYLEKEWSAKEAEDFLAKVEYRVAIIQSQPFIGLPSEKVKGVRGILITRHNKMYYKVSGKQIIILNMYDTRQNPASNPYH